MNDRRLLSGLRLLLTFSVVQIPLAVASLFGLPWLNLVAGAAILAATLMLMQDIPGWKIGRESGGFCRCAGGCLP